MGQLVLRDRKARMGGSIFFSDIPHKKWKVKQAEDQHPGGLDHTAWTFILQLLEVQAIGSGWGCTRLILVSRCNFVTFAKKLTFRKTARYSVKNFWNRFSIAFSTDNLHLKLIIVVTLSLILILILFQISPHCHLRRRPPLNHRWVQPSTSAQCSSWLTIKMMMMVMMVVMIKMLMTTYLIAGHRDESHSLTLNWMLHKMLRIW